VRQGARPEGRWGARASPSALGVKRAHGPCRPFLPLRAWACCCGAHPLRRPRPGSRIPSQSGGTWCPEDQHGAWRRRIRSSTARCCEAAAWVSTELLPRLHRSIMRAPRPEPHARMPPPSCGPAPRHAATCGHMRPWPAPCKVPEARMQGAHLQVQGLLACLPQPALPCAQALEVLCRFGGLEVRVWAHARSAGGWGLYDGASAGDAAGDAGAVWNRGYRALHKE
jgi:hypothetical protein